MPKWYVGAHHSCMRHMAIFVRPKDAVALASVAQLQRSEIVDSFTNRKDALAKIMLGTNRVWLHSGCRTVWVGDITRLDTHAHGSRRVLAIRRDEGCAASHVKATMDLERL